MKNEITYRGTIIFDPKDKTAKHKAQSSWKKIAMVEFDGDMCDYYAWFIKKRYGIILNTPIRKAHISFINDSVRDLNGGFFNPNDCGTEKERHAMWEELKKKYHNTEIEVTISTEFGSKGEHIWLKIPYEHRTQLHNIRSEIGLPLPNLGKNSDGTLKPLGLHLTIGYAVNGRVDVDEFEDGVMKAGRMNLDNIMNIHHLINNE
jgi:hypothetical protein